SFNLDPECSNATNSPSLSQLNNFSNDYHSMDNISNNYHSMDDSSDSEL
ncbi:1146_t:CDS:2, partial [Dentiscutata heterogama]